MTNEDRKRFSDLVVKIGIACSREITEQTLVVYWEALQDLELRQLERGVRDLLRTWDRPGTLPTPAQFRHASTKRPTSDEVNEILRAAPGERGQENLNRLCQEHFGMDYAEVMRALVVL